MNMFVVYAIVVALFNYKEMKEDFRLFIAKLVTKFCSLAIILLWFLTCLSYFNGKLDLHVIISSVIFIAGLLLMIPIDLLLFSLGRSTFKLNGEQSEILRQTLIGAKRFGGKREQGSR
jgi:hypothetical protein